MARNSHLLVMGCRISAALAVLRAVRPLRDRARFLTDYAYDHDQTRNIDVERDAGFAKLANSRPRCAPTLRRRGSSCHALRRAGGQPTDENQSTLESKDPAVRSTRSARGVGLAWRVAAQALILKGKSGAVAHRSREMVALGERGRIREPGQRRMSARTIRPMMRPAEPPAKGPSGQMNSRIVGLYRGERPRSGFTPPDRDPCLFLFGIGARLGPQNLARVWTAGPGEVWAGVRPRVGCVAVAGPPAEAVAHGGLAVLLHVPGWRAWYRSRRTRSYYASHSLSKRADLAAIRIPMPGIDRGGSPTGTAGVLGNGSRCGSGCLQVGGHHDARVRAVARIERRAVTGREHGRLAVGCTGKPLAAFASPAVLGMRLARAGSAFGNHPPRRQEDGRVGSRTVCPRHWALDGGLTPPRWRFPHLRLRLRESRVVIARRSL